MLESMVCLATIILTIVTSLLFLSVALVFAAFKEKKAGEYKEVTLKNQKEIK